MGKPFASSQVVLWKLPPNGRITRIVLKLGMNERRTPFRTGMRSPFVIWVPALKPTAYRVPDTAYIKWPDGK
jgi:hypothetical protein